MKNCQAESFENTDTYFIARDKEGNYLIDNNWADEGGCYQLGFDGPEFLEHTIFRDGLKDQLEFRIKKHIDNPPEYDVLRVDVKTVFNFTKV